MNDRPRQRFLWDLLLIGGLLLAALLLYLLLSAGQERGGSVVVAVEGEEVARYSLLENGTYSLNGGSNILRIENGEAWLIEADCPDQLCVHQGKIRYPGQSIICLPNRLTVTVVGGEGSGVDLMVG